MTKEIAVKQKSHQLLFYALCDDLRALTMGPAGYRETVPAAKLLELEAAYAKASLSIVDAICRSSTEPSV